jgi:hypothetical protein
LGQEDAAYINAINPFRSSLGLPLLLLSKPANFSGEWVFNEDKSTLGGQGAANLPAKMQISQKETELDIRRSFIEEWKNDRVTDEKIMLNGEESRSELFGAPRITTANLSANGDTVNFNSKVTFNRGGQSSQMTTTEAWCLRDHGRELCITQTTVSPQGTRKITMVYEKR